MAITRWNAYPYTDFHEMNLDWVLGEICKLHKDMDEFEVINQIKWKGTWNISKQYPIWSIVDNGEGFGYIAIKDVPAGIELTNEDYWRLTSNYSQLYADMQNRIIELENKVTDLEHKTEFKNYVNIKTFGAIGDGVHDDTQAIKAALNASKGVFVPAGRFRVTETIELPIGSHLLGVNSPLFHSNNYASCIVSEATNSTIKINAASPARISNLMITRAENPNTCAGVSASNVDGFIIENVRVTNHYRGFSIAGTSYSIIKDCVSERNYDDGFYLTNSNTLSVAQCQFTDCLSELNNGAGFHIVNSHSTSMAVGNMSGLKTFANSKGGVVFDSTDPSYLINGVRLKGCFLGSDGSGSGCLYLNKIGYPAIIDNCYIEESSMTNTGRNYDTPATKNAPGITITNTSGQSVQITNCVVVTSAQSGISINGECNVSNSSFNNNGIGTNNDVYKSDILNLTGHNIFSSNKFNNTKYGIYNYTDNKSIIIGNAFVSNQIPVGNIVSATVIKHNIGVNDN